VGVLVPPRRSSIQACLLTPLNFVFKTNAAIASTKKKQGREKAISPGLREVFPGSLRPGCANRLSDQQFRVSALPRDELLGAAAPHFGSIEVAILVHTELVRAP
jgi:hypothetical protein